MDASPNLGAQMEQFASVLPVSNRGSEWLVAADAYHSADDEANEMRLLGKVFPGLDNVASGTLFQVASGQTAARADSHRVYLDRACRMG